MAKRRDDTAVASPPPKPAPRKRRARRSPSDVEAAAQAICIGCQRAVSDHATLCLYAPGMTARRKKLQRQGIDLRTFGQVMTALTERKKE